MYCKLYDMYCKQSKINLRIEKLFFLLDLGFEDLREKVVKEDAGYRDAPVSKHSAVCAELRDISGNLMSVLVATPSRGKVLIGSTYFRHTGAYTERGTTDLNFPTISFLDMTHQHK